MLRCSILSIAAAFMLCASQVHAADCKPAHTVQEFLQIWNDAVIGPGNRSHACTLSLLTFDARITGIVPDKDAHARRVIENPRQFVAWYQQHPKEMFWERTLHSTVDVYEGVARVTRTYEVRDSAEGPVKATGIEDFELIFQVGEWKAFSMLWQDAIPSKPLPEGYLPSQH
ncbi:hypothetical protein ACFPT7_05040 [Acidicapsa dinghuensis]|uniref:Nuclear transport factor 2 family protein n=1 Tax=Acidicapsa dinghuensis TaxID=2218256 RepID=A0ABW1EC65_9BACT|nr:hypothetical protein [Acidicapsa dinghuensis]